MFKKCLAANYMLAEKQSMTANSMDNSKSPWRWCAIEWLADLVNHNDGVDHD